MGQRGYCIRFVYLRTREEGLRFLPEGVLHLQHQLTGFKPRAGNIGQ